MKIKEVERIEGGVDIQLLIDHIQKGWDLGDADKIMTGAINIILKYAFCADTKEGAYKALEGILRSAKEAVDIEYARRAREAN
jgi:hypothetical protein